MRHGKVHRKGIKSAEHKLPATASPAVGVDPLLNKMVRKKSTTDPYLVLRKVTSDIKKHRKSKKPAATVCGAVLGHCRNKSLTDKCHLHKGRATH